MLTVLLASLPMLPLAEISALVYWALVFFVIALVAYLLGARGVAGMSAGVGRTLLFVFLVLAIVFALIGFLNNNV